MKQLGNKTPAQRTVPFAESVIREMTRLGEQAGAINLSQELPDFDSPPQVLTGTKAGTRSDSLASVPWLTFFLYLADSAHVSLRPETISLA